MILLFHIVIALVSLAWTTWLYFSPTKGRLYTTYSLIASTIASGGYLVVMQGAHLLQTCASGLAYLSIVGFAIYAARIKLTASQIIE